MNYSDRSPEGISIRKVEVPEYSDWVCHLFGTNGYNWRPKKGEVPNWFWRKMQFLAFGNRWVKDE